MEMALAFLAFFFTILAVAMLIDSTWGPAPEEETSE